MFSEMIDTLGRGELPEPGLLRKRFDLAMTKKLGVVKLPSCFWMADPKINPRADHLLWAALLLKSRDCVDLAVSALAAELSGRPGKTSEPFDILLRRGVESMLAGLLDLAPNLAFRELLRTRVRHTPPLPGIETP